jgi:hypothetical protein
MATEARAVSFERVARRAVAGTYGSSAVRFIGLDELIENKRAAGRPKDFADVAALESAGTGE